MSVRRLLIGVCVGTLLTTMSAHPALAATRPSILVLFVDDSSQPWIRAMADGLGRVALQPGATEPVLYYEYLDTVRFDDAAAHPGQLRAWLKQKYEDLPLSLVVAVANDAVTFADEARNELWPDTPVLYVSYTSRVPDRVLQHAQSAAISFDWGFPESMAMMKAILPDTKSVAVVEGRSDVERTRQGRDVQELRRSGFNVIELKNDTLSATVAEVARLPERTALFIAGGQVDAEGTVVDTWTLCSTLSAAANRPLFMIGGPFIGCGIVGGLLRDFSKIGEYVGRRAIAALPGPLSGHEQVPFDRISSLLFDARQLERWNIDENRLPRNSEVRFRAFSPWREYRREIVAAGVGFLVQALLIAALVYERRRRVHVEDESRRNLAVAAHVDRRAALSTLSGSLAHEVSQPLSAILHNAQTAEKLIAANRASPNHLTEILHDIQTADHRVIDIVQRHRQLLKPHDLSFAPIDLDAVVRDAVSLIAHDARARHVAIEVDLPPTAIPMVGDRVLLQQVVVNLLMNAMDAMAETPRIQRRVVVSGTTKRDAIELSVRDNGSGLSDTVKGKLFEPFVTTKPQGLGIGLSIVRSIIEAHGGEIDARPVEGGGAMFHMRFPCKSKPAAAVS